MDVMTLNRAAVSVGAEEEICSAISQRVAANCAISKDQPLSSFLCGFVAGQCEKVALGACPAAMFSRWDSFPEKLMDKWYLKVITGIAEEFKLAAVKVEDEELGFFEVWVFRPGTNALKWTQCVPNSSQWHLLRGLACGVKPENIDIDYHELVRKASRCSTTEGEG